MPKLEEIRFTSNAEHLADVRNRVRDTIQWLGFTPEALNCVVLAVNEACMNVIQHAYGPNHSGEVILEIFDDGRETIFRLTDFAPPVDKTKIRSRDLDDIRPGGLGVHLINEVMDEVDFRNDPEGIGNVLVMKKRRS